jgi:hypothetical protein
VSVDKPGALVEIFRTANKTSATYHAQFVPSHLRGLPIVMCLDSPRRSRWWLAPDRARASVDVIADSGQRYVGRAFGDVVWLPGHDGSAPDAWTFRHRTFDYMNEIVHVSDGRRYVSARAVFDPTWYGAVRAMRLGMFLPGKQPLAAPRESTEQTGDTALKAIGSVSVMGPALYDIEDRGPRACPSGKPGHALHFTSRDSDYLHQLSDVVIEVSSARFCVVTFLARGAGAVVTSGSFEEHYADVNGYWVQTDGVLDGTWQASVLSRKRHGVWRYRFVDMSFPDTLSNDIFAAHMSLQGSL